MKKLLTIFIVSLFVVSCSAPKYTYNFDYHDYNAGRKQKQAAREVASDPGPVAVQPEMLVAEADAMIPSGVEGVQTTASTPKAAPLTITKSERKELVKNFKAAVKQVAKVKNSGDVVQASQASNAMDNDLKVSLVFLALSILASALTGLVNLLWIVAAAAFIVAVIFFIKWVMKQ